MATKFYIYNEVLNASIVASTENASFPIANILDDRRTKVFRSTSNTCNIVFDFGSSRPIDSFYIVDHSLTGFGVSTITLEMNGTNNWASPAFTQNVPMDSEFGIGIIDFSEVNYRFARLVLTSSLPYVEISNLFIGKKTTYEFLDISYPLNLNNNNLGIISKNSYGQRFIDEKTTQRKIKASLDNMNQAEADDVMNWTYYLSITIPFFINFDGVQSVTNANRLNGMYYLNIEPNFTLNKGNFWSCDLDMEEAT